MRYLLLLHLDPGAEVQQPASPAAHEDWVSYTDALHRAGALVSGEALHAPHTATTVQARNGRRLLTDGPYVETKDLLIGFYVIDVADLDEAVEWAARLPMPGQLTVEVWPVRPSPASAALKLDEERGEEPGKQ